MRRPPMPPTRQKAVVLDFDGVLVQSMELHAEAYRRVLMPHGATVSDRDVFLAEGARSETIIRDFLRRAGATVDDATVRALADEKQKLYKSIGQPPFYPGTRAMMERLHEEGVPLGLVTGTRRVNLERLIPHWMPWFRAVLAQDAYTHDKPHPEPYAKTAERLGVPPARCAALENAQRGVQSAKAAGYDHVVALMTTLARADFEGQPADAVVPDHEAAAEELLRWYRAA